MGFLLPKAVWGPSQAEGWGWLGLNSAALKGSKRLLVFVLFFSATKKAFEFLKQTSI